MTAFELKILTPEKSIYSDQAISVTVAGADGRLTVLAGHAPMVALLAEGPILIRTAQETLEGLAGPGIIEVDRESAAIMVHAFRWAGDDAEAPTAGDSAAEDTLL